MLGMGGGIITVPLWIAFDMPVKKAIATSAASGLIVTLVASFTYLSFGNHTTPFPDSIGYLYIPAFIAISVVSTLTAPLGAKLTQVLSTELLKYAFALVLFIAALFMLNLF